MIKTWQNFDKNFHDVFFSFKKLDKLVILKCRIANSNGILVLTLSIRRHFSEVAKNNFFLFFLGGGAGDAI